MPKLSKTPEAKLKRYESRQGAKVRVPWGMPNLLTGLLITASITVTNCAEAEGSNGLLVTLVVPATRGCPCGTGKLIYR
jgi:hypothetical protein